MSQLTKLTDEQYDRLMEAQDSGALDPLVRLIARRVIERGEQLAFVHNNEHGGIDLTDYEDLLIWLDGQKQRAKDELLDLATAWETYVYNADGSYADGYQEARRIDGKVLRSLVGELSLSSEMPKDPARDPSETTRS